MSYCPLSKWKNIFGKPNQGIHAIRFNNVAIVDYFITIIMAFILSAITKIPVEITTIFSFALGIISHILFGVNTTTTKFLKMTCNK